MPRPYNTIVKNFLFSLNLSFKKLHIYFLHIL